MRRPVLAANWKMHKTAAEAAAFARDFLPRVKDAAEVDVILAPPFTALARLGRPSRLQFVLENGMTVAEPSPQLMSDFKMIGETMTQEWLSKIASECLFSSVDRYR